MILVLGSPAPPYHPRYASTQSTVTGMGIFWVAILVSAVSLNPHDFVPKVSTFTGMGWTSLRSSRLSSILAPYGVVFKVFAVTGIGVVLCVYKPSTAHNPLKAFLKSSMICFSPVISPINLL